MSISKTNILNKALTQIGAAPITNIDDDTTNAGILRRVYEMSLRSVLSECKWNFATKRDLLTVSSETLDWYYTGEVYIYEKPSDIIRIFGTNDDASTWREEGDYIISDTSGLGLLYVYYLDNPSKYPISFIDALVDKLCSDIAYTIVNSASLGDKYKESYERVSLAKAMSMNAQSGTQQYIKDDAWELAKYNNDHAEA